MMINRTMASLGLRDRARALGWVLAILVVACLSPGGRAAAQVMAAPAAGDSLVEIVVTARKQSENLLEAPVAVQYVSGNDLSRSGTVDLAGLGNDVAELRITPILTGTGGSISIRGVASPVDNVGVESSVSLVFDGVQLSRSALGQLGLFDVKSVQVLEGPQALFFGKNSPAGVVAVSSNGPTDTLQGYARAGYELNAQEPSFEAAIGGPITDTLRFRMAFKVDTMGGYMTNAAQPVTYANPFLGVPIPNLPATFSVPGAKIHEGPDNRDLAGRIALEWAPLENFSALLHVMPAQVKNNASFDYQIVDRCASETSQLETVPTELGLPIPGGRCSVGTTFATNQPNPQFVGGNTPGQVLSAQVSSLQLDYKVAKLNFTSVTGYATYHNDYFEANTNLGLFDSKQHDGQTQTSEELRVRSDFDFPLNFLAGVYYESTSRNDNVHVWFFTGLLPVNPTTGGYDGSWMHSTVDGRTYSPFLQATWKISDALNFDLGARYTHESRNMVMNNSVVSPWLPILGLNYLSPTDILRDSESSNNVSPEGTLTWHPRDKMLVYGAFKTGYKSGGYGAPSTLTGPPNAVGADYAFRPEKASGGEIGFKARFLGDTLQITSTIYDYKFKDLQESVSNARTLSFTTLNAASATTKGIETDFLWRAFQDLTLHASINYNRARFESFPDAPCYAGQTAGCTANNTQDLSGTTLPSSSDWSEIAGFTWERAILDGYRLTLGGNAKYLGPFNSSADHSSAAYWGPIWLLGANAGFQSDDENSLRVEVIGRNLLNKIYEPVSYDRTAGAATDQYGPINRPREIWIQLTKKFGR